MRAESCFIKIQRAFHRDRDKILKLPTPHGLGGLGLEKATQYLKTSSQVKLRSRSCQAKSSRVYDHNNLQAQVFADMKGTLTFKLMFKLMFSLTIKSSQVMADMKGTLDFKFTIFSLLCTLWVTDKPSNLDKPSRRFACDTLWVRPTNPHPLHGAPARHHTRPDSPLTGYQPSQHTHLVQEH